jgi:hypothetical protein
MRSRVLCAVAVVTAMSIAACTRAGGTVKAGMDSDIQIAERFGTALAKGDFAGAHGLLTGQALQMYSPENLKEEVDQMTSYAPGPIQHVEVTEPWKDWPDRKPGDISTVYVALTSESFSEAVIVVVCSTPAGTRIREIDWGRP